MPSATVARLLPGPTSRNLHDRVYKQEGTITTAFEIRVTNDMDRFHVVQDVLDHLPQLGNNGAYLEQMVQGKLIEHKRRKSTTWTGRNFVMMYLRLRY